MAKMREAIALDPRIMDAHLTLGNWLVKLKRARRGDRGVQEGARPQARRRHRAANLAYVYRGRDQLEAALEGYRGVLRVDPKNPQAWYQLATLYLDLGRRDEAAAEFTATVAANPDWARRGTASGRSPS